MPTLAAMLVARGAIAAMPALAKELAFGGEVLDLTPDKIQQPDKIYDFSLIKIVIEELKSANWRPTS